MELLIGSALALLVGIATHALGMDRERVFYPTVLIVVATYYLLFAAVGNGGEPLLPELAVAAFFIAAAVWGWRRNLWWVVAGLAGHGLMDAVHHLLVHNAGVPPSWPGFCMAYDLVAAAWLAWLLQRRGLAAVSPGAAENPAHGTRQTHLGGH
ncbi:hypothetical protein [Inhella sp.]|uniref:hypothetical protein n=1 Tax=Inhella sp. TaxID=1921806 RepID=UPI0035B03788